MKKMPSNHPPDPSSPLALEKAEKGSQRSMWELLLQLRVLLPYLKPLIEKGLGTGGPHIDELHKGMAVVQTGSRELEVQARNQALQLERIEQQMARLRVVHESSIEESRMLSAEIRSFRRWMIIMGVAIVVLLVITVGMVSFLVIHP